MSKSMGAENPNVQIPNPNEIPISKSQSPMPKAIWLAARLGRFLIGHWSLDLGISLGFGI
jgi:hypothetical protein